MSQPPHPTTRVLAMLELLQAHHRISGAELARRLGVDERTVRRYAARLDDLGVPVVADPVRHVTASLARVPYAHEVEVVLDAALAEARRRIPASVTVLAEDGGGGVVMTMRAERLDGAARMPAGLGFPFTIRRPAELRGHVRGLARSLEEQAAR